MSKKQFILGMFLASVLGAGIALGGYSLLSSQISEQKFFLKGNGTSTDVKYTSSVPQDLNFVVAANKTASGVVHIKTYKEVNVNQSYNNQNQMFRDFFFEMDPRFRQQIPQQENERNEEGETKEQQAGSGSGVIITVDGYIATNNHVVEGADKIEVTLHDKRTYEAMLIGTDPTTDLALLKIEETALDFIEFGNSDDVQIGEWVLAVGNPFDLTSTVTAGIVSAKGRNIHILRDKDNLQIESFIQTDAAVNPGNSGGALVNLQGQLIGINSAIATPTGSYAGYSFAVPSTLVKKVIVDLKEYGEVQRALLGVSIMDVNAELAKEKGIDEIEGVYIESVNENSAAQEAGLKEGDIILKVNETEVNSTPELQEAVARFRPGKEATITYKRDGKEKTADVIFKNKMGTTEVVKSDDEVVISALGAEMRSINDTEKEKYGITSGVKITKINTGKFKDLGFKEGFIITKIGSVKVTSPAQVQAALSNKESAYLIEGLNPDGSKAYEGFGW